MAKGKAASKGAKKAVKSAVKAAAKSAKGKVPAAAASGEETIRRNSVNPEKLLKHYGEYDKSKRSHEIDVDTASSSGSRVREVLKKAKAAGINPDVLVEYRKLEQLPIEEVGEFFGLLNDLHVLRGRAVPVRRAGKDVVAYSNQLGFFDDGESVADKIDAHAANEGGGEGRVSLTQIDSAKAKGAKAANDGDGPGKNPYDEHHPLNLAWEGARQDRLKIIAAKTFGGEEPSGAAH